MKNILFTGLRARLMFLVLAVIVPILVLIVYHGIESRNNERIEALNRSQGLARTAAALYENTIMEASQLFFALSQTPQFREQDPDACSKIFADLLKRTKNYNGLAAAKPNGKVFASAPTITKPVSFADRPWFQHLVQTRGFVIGKYTKIGRISGKPTVVMGYPVLDHTGRLMTVITAGLDLERLQQTLLTIDLPDGATLNVIDSNGMILLRFPDPEQFLGKKMHDKSIVKAMLTKKEGAEEGIGLGGAPRLYGYTTVGSGVDAIHISVGIPEQVAYAAVERHMARDLALLGLVSALALLGVWLFGGGLIISPVNRLLYATKRVADGDLTVRTGQSDASGELGLLASNFDRMAESLQRREEERKQAEERIGQLHEYLHLQIERMPIGLIVWDTEFRVTSWNPAAEKTFGFTAQEAMGKHPYGLIVPKEAQPHVDDIWGCLLEGDTTAQSINDNMTKDGRTIICQWSNTPFKGDDGTVRGVLSMVQDITELKQAEEALRANEEKYRLHFENVSDIIFSFDREFRILSISPSLERVLGYKPEEFIGKPFPELNILPPEYLEKAFSDAMQVFAGEHLDSITYELIARDGTRKYMEFSSAPLFRDGQVVAAVSVARNITDRKQTEDMLRITQFSVDSAAESVAWVRRDGRYLYANDAYCRLLNYSRDEMLSMRVCDLDPDISAENWPGTWGEIKQQEVSVFESSRRTKDGILIPVEIYTKYQTYGDKEFLVTFLRDIRERKLHEEQLKRQIDRLAALRAIDMAITASLDIRVTFNIFLEQVINTLHVDAADVLVLNSRSYNKLTFVAGRGFRTNALRHTNLSLGEGFAGRVAQERKTLCIPDLEKEPQDLLKHSPKLSSEGFVSYYGIPLIAKGQVKGVLEIFNRTPLEPDRDWLDYLEALASQAAIAVDNAMLFDDLQKSNIDLIQAYDNTLEGWSNALDLRDKETEGHSQRVTEITLRIARQMGMRDSELVHVRRGALLHDIGKMGIPDGILLKPGPLDDEEWEIMRKHPVYAYEFLYPISYLRPALDIPYSHHEKWDGTGYPRGLKGVHIPLAARIFAIVDVWDALRSDRPYRPAWPEEKTREHIRELAG
ncbi:MAG: PAS domain S-box protein, partial [Thermoplasmata archaeon]|nr:PAS domain S-box protein [Thermoplasmata archaeon]